MICFTLLINSETHQSAKRKGTASVPLLTPQSLLLSLCNGKSTWISTVLLCLTLIYITRMPVTKKWLGVITSKPDESPKPLWRNTLPLRAHFDGHFQITPDETVRSTQHLGETRGRWYSLTTSLEDKKKCEKILPSVSGDPNPHNPQTAGLPLVVGRVRWVRTYMSSTKDSPNVT